ncbi:MAG: hypothetical protein WAT41_14465 [Flavobacteriales bacterium]
MNALKPTTSRRKMSLGARITELSDLIERVPKTKEYADRRYILYRHLGYCEAALEQQHNTAIARMMMETRRAFSLN